MTEEIVLGGLSRNDLAKAALGLFEGRYEAHVTLMEVHIPDGSSDGHGGPAVYLFEYPNERTADGYHQFEDAKAGRYKVVDSEGLATQVQDAATDSRTLIWPGLLEDANGRHFRVVMPEYYIDHKGQFVELRSGSCEPFEPQPPDNFPMGIHLANFRLVPVPQSDSGRPFCRTPTELVNQFRQEYPQDGMREFRTWLRDNHKGRYDEREKRLYWESGVGEDHKSISTFRNLLTKTKKPS